jgi:hypothetical protein
MPALAVSITTGTDSGVASTFLTSTPITPPAGPANPTFQAHYIYVTPPPLNFSQDRDLKHYQEATSTNPLPSFPPAGGTSCVVLDYPPNPTGAEGKLHRTQTLDYIFILEGMLECSLDSGEKRIFQRGDVIVQRASMRESGYGPRIS